jgi:hypothetical protein
MSDDDNGSDFDFDPNDENDSGAANKPKKKKAAATKRSASPSSSTKGEKKEKKTKTTKKGSDKGEKKEKKSATKKGSVKRSIYEEWTVAAPQAKKGPKTIEDKYKKMVHPLPSPPTHIHSCRIYLSIFLLADNIRCHVHNTNRHY